MERVRFEDHKGQRILVVDCKGLGPSELMEIFDEVQEIVTSEAAGSVMTLTDFTGAEFNKQAADRLKLVAALDRPYVRRAAIVGLDSLPDVYYRNLLSFSARQFPAFKTYEEALQWLLSDSHRAAD